MYSAFYHYFEIRSDSNYGKLVSTSDVKKTLCLFTELSEKTYIEYDSITINNLSICLLKANERGCYSSSESIPQYINLISVVASKFNHETERETIINLLTEIASKLNWQLVEEGDEDVILFNPR